MSANKVFTTRKEQFLQRLKNQLPERMQNIQKEYPAIQWNQEFPTEDAERFLHNIGRELQILSVWSRLEDIPPSGENREIQPTSTAGDTHIQNILYRFSHYLRFPSWVFDWRLQLAHAANDQDHQEFNYTSYDYGVIKTKLELREGLAAAGYLIVSWDANEYSPGGWWIAIYTAEGDPPAFCQSLGMEPKGSTILTAVDLGFNPQKIPFRYMIYPG
jgi:hypothetical protein